MYAGAVILLSFMLVDAQIFQESFQPEGHCELRPLFNGEVNYNGNSTFPLLPAGETVEVRCFEGFRLSNTRAQLVQLTCQTDGSWTDNLHTVSFPVCDKMGGCSLPIITHGRAISKSDGTFMPGEATFVLCDQGYTMFSSGSPVESFITCQHDGQWKNGLNSSVLTCEAMPCGYPVLINHGSYMFANPDYQTTSNTYASGTQLYYTCDTGYELREGITATVTCQMGMWMGTEQLECVSKGSANICPHPQRIANGYYTLSFKDDMYGTKYYEQIVAGTSVYFSCDLGYKLSGQVVKTCINGQWLPMEPTTCVSSAKGCSQPPKILFGNYTFGPSYSIYQSKLPEDTVAYYSCINGYKIKPEDGKAQLVCKDTRWQGTTPGCEQRSGCDKPMDISDGNWVIDGLYPDHRVGSRVIYECNEGYRLIGSSVIVCDAFSYWSDNAPKCLRKDQFCSDPGSIANGFYVCKPNNCDNFRVGTEVHFMCSKGYDIQPTELAVQTCEAGGYWTGSALLLYCSPEAPSTTVTSIMFLSEPSTLVVLVVTICGILGLLLLVIIIVAVQRRMKRRVPVPFCADQPPFLPSVAAQPLRHEHDRVALISFPDVDSTAVLPTYEEALRTRPSGQRIARFSNELAHSSSIRSIRSDYRLLPHVGVSSISRTGTPAVQMREQHSLQEHRADHRRNSIVTNASMMTRDNMSLAFGSVETVNVSDATSTTVTIGTFESGGSNPSLAASASQRATAGSVASAGSPTEEDVPLLDSSSCSSSGGAGTLGRGARQQVEPQPIPEEEHQD